MVQGYFPIPFNFALQTVPLLSHLRLQTTYNITPLVWDITPVGMPTPSPHSWNVFPTMECLGVLVR